MGDAIVDIINDSPHLVQTCSACPSQWEGNTADGDNLYIRVRHGALSVDIDHKNVFYADVSDQFDGVMTLDEVLERIGDAETPGIDFRANDIKDMPQYQQHQGSLNDQLKLVHAAASKLGCYDAADFIRSKLER